ncbi:helix-turn-helix transcriptional regulator [Rhizohabitans arisaemae]|uniref:helix-turn-helix transcriptional regulator n=1 Tax=Rhizohabitans arisaemae TaxID=2720610 RepID=UPI0024B03FD1|nr:helix-turn-helix transcriptional regulator [Rhizohabitans arisaemae]
MRVQRLAEVTGVVLADIHFQPAALTWSPSLPETVDAICLVRSGWFRRAAVGRTEFLDAAYGYIARIGVEERVFGREARLTWIQLTPDAYDTLVQGHRGNREWFFAANPALDLRHRELIAAAGRGTDGFEMAERTHALLAALPARTERPGPGRRPRTLVAHRSLTDSVREALNHDPTIGLDSLAKAIGYSPHHVSRVFSAMTGRSVTDYRNELRVRSVLEDLAQGADNLADLATRHGFADHAHLTRTVVQKVGRTPSALRRQLSTGRRTSRDLRVTP